MLTPSYMTRIHSLDPIQADIRLEFDNLPEGAEVRGRLMGPRCPGVSTIEVAYHLRPLTGGDKATYQVLIPEPNFWAPEHPFRYEGPVEYWRAGELLGKTTISIGLKS